MSRFPFPLPLGWFQVAYDDELKPGDVMPLRYFGRDLVLWRADDGAAHLMDAFCPHLGAHLGYGGVVEAGTIRCPFHGWEYDGTGACAEIPYSDRVNRSARVGTYPLVARNQLLMAWYHPHGLAPDWEVPELPEIGSPEFTDYYRSSYIVKTAWQEMAENAVDPAHFRYVHGTDSVAEVLEYATDGPTSKMISVQQYVTPRGVTEGHIDAYIHGPGFSYTWFTGIVDALLVGTVTPIDDDTVQTRFNFTVRKLADERTTSTAADAFVAEINKQLTEDIPIWEHKAHLIRPALADTDGPIMKFRKWATQFYVDGATPANADV